jgi:arylsulfatase A-like enzyme
MTGKHTGHTWVRGNGALPEGDVPLRAEEVTIAELLRERGYRTGLVGKWGLGQPGTPGMPDKQGFDYAFGFLDQRHAHRQFTDHFYRNGEPFRSISSATTRRPVHEGSGARSSSATIAGPSSST